MGVLSLGHGLAPPLGPAEAIAAAFLPPGLILAAMIGRLAQRRFFDAALIDGGPTIGAAEIDRRVLANTVEQMAPALCVWPGVWPALAVSLGPRGPGVVTALGGALAPARIAFWVGYHRSPRPRLRLRRDLLRHRPRSALGAVAARRRARVTSRAGRHARDGAPTIRPARPEDAPAIAAIWNPVIRDTTITVRPKEWREADLRAWIDDHARGGRPVLVAEDADAGFAALGQLRPVRGYARTLEHTLMLAPAARGRSLGRALLAAVEARARSGGARTIWAAVSAENAAAIAFHLACGYAEAARLPEVGLKFGRPIDLVSMTKRF